MTRRGIGILSLGAALGAIVLGVPFSRAGAAATPDVVIDCASLSNEQRASLEARTRAELAMNRLTESEIQISCMPPLVVVTYTTNGVPIRSNSAHLVQDINQWVEEILTLIAAAITPPAGPGPQPVVAQSTPDTPAMSAPNTQLPPKPATGASDQHWPEPLKRDGSPKLMSIGGGLCSELWAKPANAFLGPCASVGLRVSSLSRLAATGATQWGVTKPDQVALHLWQAAVEARYGRAFWFALGVQLSAIHVAPESNLLPKSKFAYEPTLVLRGGFSTSLAGQRLVAGPGLRGYAAKSDVRVNGNSLFQLPILALSLEIECEFDP